MANAFWDSEKVIKDVPKAGTKNTFYRFKEVTKNGRTYIDFREHYTRSNGSEQYTTKGTAIPIESFTDVLIAIRDIGDILSAKEVAL